MSEKVKSNDWRESAKDKRIRGLIATELLQIFETYNDTTVAAHLVMIMRTKEKAGCEPVPEGVAGTGVPKKRDPYYLKDEEFLKDIQNYKVELEEKLIEDDE